MGDDGNRQVALTLDTVKVAVGLSEAQFNVLEMGLNGINGAINKLAENVSDPDTSVATEISSLSNEVSLLKHEISVGFSGLQQSIADLNNTIHERSIDLAKWLAAIALATANPDNNEAAVQAKIDEITADIRASSNVVEDAINQDKSKG